LLSVAKCLHHVCHVGPLHLPHTLMPALPLPPSIRSDSHTRSMGASTLQVVRLHTHTHTHTCTPTHTRTHIHTHTHTHTHVHTHPHTHTHMYTHAHTHAHTHTHTYTHTHIWRSHAHKS